MSISTVSSELNGTGPAASETKKLGQQAGTPGRAGSHSLGSIRIACWAIRIFLIVVELISSQPCTLDSFN
ncbi:hypothetical protein L1F29_19005 [Paenibacillus spongiae]|uniref:Uncharacterized protein n=1 Tax=Paenibacillus spongiae TaxID=2909671 RepID=A0ABY5SI20_9BACL|nr:hypothetical protein [Paenibacillus spongiae]UVI33681.1 hypothetical protein L1F29_19005 [Paenibacillus spongiae]